MNYLSEAFKQLEILNEDVFDLDKDGLEDLRDFQDKDEEEVIDVIDPDAEDEEELKDSYVGKVILDCSVCHTDIYRDKEDVIIDEETQLANVGEECPYCFSVDGFNVIGEVKPFVETEVETEDDVEVEVDGEEVEEDEDEKEEKNESLKRKRRMIEAISRRNRKSLTEAPVYGLEPRYDARKSFYGKAQVDTGDKGDKNKLYSYNTLVAEIKDGKPVVYGTYSQTTLRHIKDWLKQNGFKAETSKQIMADYGVKDESCDGKKPIRESSWDVFHNDNGLDYTIVERSKSGKNALLNRGKQWIIAWNCPQDNKGSWGQGHYFFDEDEAREWWSKKYIKESKAPMKISKRPIKESCSINQCQKWVDYDMKKYKRISDDTMEKIKSSGYSVVKDQYGDYEVIADRKDESCEKRKSRKMKESIEDITIDTGDQEIQVSARDKEKEPTDDEMIAPLSDEEKIEMASEEEKPDEDIDVDFDEFSEEEFDELGESYLKKVYENVKNYKTTSIKSDDKKLYIEGLIKFNSGKEKKTSFIFESKTITKNGKAKLIGENLQISKGHKSFKLGGTLKEGKFISESLNYNYRAKDGNESKRVYGTVKVSK